MQFHDDVRPWDLVLGTPQTAGDYAPESVGAQASRGTDDGSPWYAGSRYYASASDAAFWRRVHAQPIGRLAREG